MDPTVFQMDYLHFFIRATLVVVLALLIGSIWGWTSCESHYKKDIKKAN